MQDPPGPPAPDAASAAHGASPWPSRLLGAGLGALAALVLMSLPVARSYAPVTRLYGGAGGQEQSVRCGSGWVVGAEVATQRSVVAGIRLLCASSEGAAPAPTSDVLGMMSGPVKELRCPNEQRAVGIWGAVGGYVDTFSLSCAPDANGPMRHLEAGGGQAGWGFHARCQGQLTGLRARAGALVDAVGPICSEEHD